MFTFAMFMSLCGDVMVMSSVYFVRFAGAFDIGMSYEYMLNNVGYKTLTCGTPVKNWRYVNVLFLNVVYVLRTLI